MSDGCIFCRIAAGEAPARILFENEHVMAFFDAHPVAPTHVLVIPKRHIESIYAVGPEDAELLGKLMLGVRKVAEDLGLAGPGFRTIINTGRGAGQSVFHLHVHVMSGRSWTWP